MATPQWFEHRGARVALAVVGVLLLLVTLSFVALQAMQSGQGDTVLAGVHVDGETVGGSSRAELVEVVDARSRARLEDPVIVVASEGELETDRAGVGASVDEEATVDEAWRRGRRGLFRALWDHLRARAGATVEIVVPVEVEDGALQRWADDAVEQLSQPPQETGVDFVAGEGDGVEVEVTEPREGRSVEPDAIVAEVEPRVREPGEIRVEVPARTEVPALTGADLDAVLPQAELAVSAPVTLTNPSAGEDLVLDPPDLASVLVVEERPDEPEGERLVVSSDADRLREHLGDGGVEALEEPPVEADFRVSGGSIEIVGGTPGFAVDLDGTAARVVALATEEDEREGQLAGDTSEPELSREEAADLGIEEEVSSFTTDLVPGQERNVNIHRGADLFHGSVIRPGERFSLDEAIGTRTRERGFVENGFIDEDGELTEVVGGGSSQLATTFMNAAWFAGIEIVEFQPHSYYFERYPMGRESTLSRGQIDVVVENDSPHAIFVSSSYTSSSVTVTFFSSTWAEVDTWTDEPRDRVAGDERDGFTVDFGRTITYPDGSTRDEEYTHRYEPQD
jgi:vancomycin resistance protein YoaR